MLVLRQSLITILVLIGVFLVVPLIALLRRGVGSRTGIAAPTAHSRSWGWASC